MEFSSFTIYGYLFASRYDNVLQYKILSESGKYFVYRALLDHDLENDRDTLLSYQGNDITDALRWIIESLRSMEIDVGLYPSKSVSPDPLYLPLLAEIEDNIRQGSVVILGNPNKYALTREVKDFMEKFGYDNLATHAPDQYVLEEYILQEQD